MSSRNDEPKKSKKKNVLDHNTNENYQPTATEYYFIDKMRDEN